MDEWIGRGVWVWNLSGDAMWERLGGCKKKNLVG